MKAYNMAMLLIFINVGAFLMAQTGAFGMAGHASNYEELSWLSNVTIKIPLTDYSFTGVEALAGLLLIGTAVAVGTKAFSASGIAFVAFAGVFWGSFALSAATIWMIPLPGMDIFFGIFTLAATLIFVVTLIQMPTGGQKSYE